MTSFKRNVWYLAGLGAVAIVVIVLAIEQIGPPSSSARTSTQVVTAEKGVVQTTVSGSGNVEAGTDLDVNFKTSGTLSQVYVEVGQHVKQGQLLATLNPTSAQLSLDQANQSLTAAEDQLRAAKKGESTGSTNSGSSSDSTATGASLIRNSRATEFVAYQITTPGKRKQHTQTTATTPTTTTETTPTTTTPTTPRTTPTTPPTTTTTTTPQTTTTTPSPASIASAEASVYSAEANVNSAEDALANTKLYAPITGTIVSLASLQPGDSVSAGSTSSGSSTPSSSSSSSASGGSGTTAGSLGGSGSSSSSSSSGSASGSGSFAEIVNTSTMTMTVALSESDVSKVKVGQSATVTLEALTGVKLAAHVSSVSTVGTTSSGVVSYDATLTLDQSDSRVKPGMSATASVIVGQAPGVTVPNSALTGTGSLGTLHVVKDGKSVTQQVVVGLKGDDRTVIISGLRAGDQVAMTTTLPSLGSSASSSSSGAGSGGTLGGTRTRLGGSGLAGGGGGFSGGGGGFPAGGSDFPGGG